MRSRAYYTNNIGFHIDEYCTGYMFSNDNLTEKRVVGIILGRTMLLQ